MSNITQAHSVASNTEIIKVASRLAFNHGALARDIFLDHVRAQAIPNIEDAIEDTLNSVSCTDCWDTKYVTESYDFGQSEIIKKCHCNFI